MVPRSDVVLIESTGQKKKYNSRLNTVLGGPRIQWDDRLQIEEGFILRDLARTIYI